MALYPSSYDQRSNAAPGAGAQLARLSLTPGIYDIEVGILLDGTAETAKSNVRLQQNNVDVAATLPSVSGVYWYRTTLRVNVVTPAAGGLCTVELEAIAAATAGSVYNSTLTATRIA